MKPTNKHCIKNTKEAQELLLSMGYYPHSDSTFDIDRYAYISVFSNTIGGRIKEELGNRLELYCYDGDFHETPKEDNKIKRPTLAELLQIDEVTLKYLQSNLTWGESLKYQLERLTTIKKELADKLSFSDPSYSELLRLIKYYDGAIEDVKGNIC